MRDKAYICKGRGSNPRHPIYSPLRRISLAARLLDPKKKINNYFYKIKIISLTKHNFIVYKNHQKIYCLYKLCVTVRFGSIFGQKNVQTNEIFIGLVWFLLFQKRSRTKLVGSVWFGSVRLIGLLENTIKKFNEIFIGSVWFGFYYFKKEIVPN